MKRNLIYITIGLAAISATSCADLDTQYYGSLISDQQREDVVSDRPDMLLAGVATLNSNMTRCNAYSGEHFDFGFPAVMLGLDCQTADLNGGNSGYNWFATWSAFVSQRPTGIATSLVWGNCYGNIRSANSVIGMFDSDVDDPVSLFYLANAYGYRAFNYWVLANLYQFNYQLDPTAPCVPIITDKNTEEVLANGAPRASVQEVFNQIMSDLDTAIAAFEASGYEPVDLLGEKPKRLMSLAVAYGLRTRANLTMGKYQEAAADAQAAIEHFTGRPYAIAEVSKPAFNSLNDDAWMWGIAVNETDRVVTSGIVNWPSQVCSFAYGYVTVGAWRWCSKDLYDQIPYTDVRKGWFLDEDYQSKNLSKAQQAYLNDYVGDVTYDANQSVSIYPYTNVKFDSYQSILEQTMNANDIPLMRIEEMYLSLAEAQAMSGNPALGAETLTDFISTYRDKSYVCQATAAKDIQEECFQQRRVELWGEGLIYFDYMRLNKGVDRRRARAPYAFTYDIQPGDPVLLYCIPQSEINANAQINADQNNPTSSRPATVDWID